MEKEQLNHYSPSTSKSEAELSQPKPSYQDLMDQTQGAEADGSDRKPIDPAKELEKLDEVLESVEGLFAEVRTTADLYKDAVLFTAAVNRLTEASSAVATGDGEFDGMEWTNAFIRKTIPKGDESEFEALNNAAEPFYEGSTIPGGLVLLCGGLDPSEEVEVPPKRERAQRQAAQPEARREEPQAVADAAQADSVEANVRHVFSKLRRHYRDNNQRPIHFYKFVIDPTSMANSFRNIFHFSFLIKDNHARMEVVDGEPMISPILERPSNENAQPGPRDIKTNIVSLNYDRWELLKQKYDIQTAMI